MVNPRQQVCPTCKGTRMCQSCNGSGEVEIIPDCYEDNCYADCRWCNATGYCVTCCPRQVYGKAYAADDRDNAPL